MRGRIIAPDKSHGKGKRATWSYVVELDRFNGKRQRKTVGGFRTRKNCQHALAAALADLGRGRDPFPTDIGFSDYAARWLEHKAADGLRPTTRRRYAGLLDDPVLEEVRRLQLRSIKPAHIRRVIDQGQARGLAPRTVVQLRAVLGGVLKQAMRDGLIENNPVLAISRPKVARANKVVPTAEQVTAFIELSRGTEMAVPLLLAATTGARRSEVCAVRWADLDFASSRMRITRGLQWATDDKGRHLGFTEVKSERARRTVRLLPGVVECLRHHRKAQTEQRLALGVVWQDYDLVCERGDGSPIDPDALTKAFKRLAAQAGLDPRTRLHDLRHAVATQLARKGVHPHTVSTILGHSSTAFTMDVYTEEWDEGQEQAAAALGEAYKL